MLKHSRALSVPAFLLLAFATIGKVYAADAAVLYSDDFSNVAGYAKTNTDGQETEAGIPATRQTHIFVSESTFGGSIVLSATEDNKTIGADEKTGVLALTYGKVPSSADFSGFVFAGSEAKPISLPKLGPNSSEADLKKLKLSFRYKAINANEKHVGATYNCRFERSAPESYEQRIDFGELVATGKWQTFEKVLSDGENTSEFLDGVNSSTERAFQIVWGQEGEVSNYDAGDTLLIDDVKISVSE